MDTIGLFYSWISMKKFIICSASWFPSSGGLTILHKFVNDLNLLGYDAYIAPTGPSGIGWHPPNIPFNSPTRYNNVKLVTEEVLSNLDECVVVYSETWYGNLLNAPNVVRWIMGPVNPRYMTEGTINGFRYSSWTDSDLWFWYTPLYTTSKFTEVKKDFDNHLNVVEFYKDVFLNSNKDRFLNCWTMRKSTGKINPEDYIHHPTDLFIGDIDRSLPNPDFDFPGNVERLSQLFNLTNTFYSYDAYTFVSIQSLMCGATSVVYPIPGVTLDDYLSGNPLHRYNAYGLSDIERATSIKDELFGSISDMEHNSISQIHTFVQKCYDFFK